MQPKLDLKGSLPYFLILLVVVPLDQLTKFWVRTNMFLGESRPPDGFFRITYVQNTGASFGIFPDAATFFTAFSTASFVIILVVAVFFRSYIKPIDTNLGKLTLGLVSAGTLGNLIDRYTLGYVVDFLDFRFWPVFNVADSAIVAGAILMAYIILISYRSGEANNGGQS